MRRSAIALWFGLCLVAFAGAAPAAAGHKPRVHVTPATGRTRTTFVITFTAPAPAGTSGIHATTYEISAIGPQGSGCRASVSKTIRHAHEGARERVALHPGTRGWCAGDFHGTIELISGPNCVKGQVCPEFVSIASVVGRFKFQVK